MWQIVDPSQSKQTESVKGIKIKRGSKHEARLPLARVTYHKREIKQGEK